MRYIYFSLAFLCLFSCTTPNPWKHKVKGFMNDFPTEFTNHFPNDFNDWIYGYSSRVGGEYFKNFGHALYVIYNISNSTTLSTYKKSVESQKSCVLKNTEQYYLIKDKKNRSFDGIVIYNDSIPIPSFRNTLAMLDFIDPTLAKLPDDFTVYVIETKSGIFLDENNLVRDDLIPEPWQHGMSRGVAISEKRNMVVAWLTMW